MRNMTAAGHSLDHQGADGSWNPDQLKPTLLSRKRHE